MPFDLFIKYGHAMDKIEARENLASIEIASYPHMVDNTNREKIFNKYHDRAFEEEIKIVTTDELARMLMNGQRSR